MSDLKIVLSYLRARRLLTFLTVFSVALGLALATIVLLLSNQTQRTLNAETAYWDLVVGAKGSPLQLVLNSLYYLDAPTGNVEIAAWERLKDDPAMERVIPLTLGDNYFGAPIVGTTPALFDGRRARQDAPLYRAGECFTKPFEAVVGADVAARHGLQLTGQIIGAHGWGDTGDFHPDHPYTVVGILNYTGTNMDRAVYTDYRSTWLVHEHGEEIAHGDESEHHGDAGHHEEAAHEEHEEHDEDITAAGVPVEHHEHGQEVTALLVRLHQPGARFRMVQAINVAQAAQAVIPVDEIAKVARTFIAPLQGVLLLVAYLVVLVSALTILISLYHSIHQRRRDLAVIRSLGATRGDIVRLVALEAAVLSALGVVAGGCIGHGLVALGAPLVLARFGIALDPWQCAPLEGVIAVSVWALGVLAGLLPAMIAYRLPVADTLLQE